ncbi:Peroxidase, partial [Thalictrum thalictroides]
MWETAKNLSVLVLTVSLLLSLVNQSAEQIKNGRLDSSTSSFSWIRHLLYFNKEMKIDDSLLEYDFYKDSCPNAEQLVEMTMRSIYKKQPDVAPALLRLMFHDCFIQ